MGMASATTSTGSVLYKSKDAKKFVLNTASLKADQVNFRIIDQTGGIIYSDEINTSSIEARLFDMSRQPNGSYTVEIEDATRVTTYEVSLNQNDIQIEGNPSVDFKPVFRMTDDHTVGFNYLSLGKNATVRLANENETIFDETLLGETSIERQYRLKNMKPGNYTLTVIVDGKAYYQSIDL